MYATVWLSGQAFVAALAAINVSARFTVFPDAPHA
jgi:hypothetical protein